MENNTATRNAVQTVSRHISDLYATLLHEDYDQITYDSRLVAMEPTRHHSYDPDRQAQDGGTPTICLSDGVVVEWHHTTESAIKSATEWVQNFRDDRLDREDEEAARIEAADREAE